MAIKKATKKVATKKPAAKAAAMKPAAPKQTAPNKVEFVGFFRAIKNFFTRAFDVRGTSTRAEFWWVMLFTTAISIAMRLTFGNLVINPETGLITMPAGYLTAHLLLVLVLLIPSITIVIRRMHDIGKSGWAYYAPMFICWVVLVSAMALLIANPESVLAALSFLALTIIMLIISIYLLVLLMFPSKLDNNKYRVKKS